MFLKQEKKKKNQPAKVRSSHLILLLEKEFEKKLLGMCGFHLDNTPRYHHRTSDRWVWFQSRWRQKFEVEAGSSEVIVFTVNKR